MGKIRPEPKINLMPAVIAFILLFLSVFDLPYIYYQFLRVVILAIVVYYSFVGIYFAYYIYESSPRINPWLWSFLVVMILFNPLAPVYLHEKILWGIIDIILAVFFVGLVFRVRKIKKE